MTYVCTTYEGVIPIFSYIVTAPMLVFFACVFQKNPHNIKFLLIKQFLKEKLSVNTKNVNTTKLPCLK